MPEISQELVAKVQRIPAMMRHLATMRSVLASLPRPVDFTDEQWSEHSFRYVPAVEELEMQIANEAKAQSDVLQAFREAVAKAHAAGSITDIELMDLRKQGMAGLRGLGALPLIAWGVALAIASVITTGVVVHLNNHEVAAARAQAAATIATSIARAIDQGRPIPALPDLSDITGGSSPNPFDGIGKAIGGSIGTALIVGIGIYALVWALKRPQRRRRS
jgi:hypothetical protein